eukprot:EC825641.1.p1 GENE.EC825641.1~~EC825641.1.p1  ORF type:complete len:67 (+),score=24.81 EC825641.1:38-238(+)
MNQQNVEYTPPPKLNEGEINLQQPVVQNETNPEIMQQTNQVQTVNYSETNAGKLIVKKIILYYYLF